MTRSLSPRLCGILGGAALVVSGLKLARTGGHVEWIVCVAIGWFLARLCYRIGGSALAKLSVWVGMFGCGYGVYAGADQPAVVWFAAGMAAFAGGSMTRDALSGG